MHPTKPTHHHSSIPFLPHSIIPPTHTHPNKLPSSAVGDKAAADRLTSAGGSREVGLGPQQVVFQKQRGEGERGESQLTAQQRKVVGDISRLFSSQASRPTKLLIRLNQTQVGSRGEGGLAQSKLQRIEITRLDEGEGKGQFPNEPSSKGELLWRGGSQQELSSASSIKIPLSEQGSQVALSESRPIVLGVSRQVSMMFVPELTISTLLGMKNPPQLFSRFNRKAEQRVVGGESVGSNFSENFSEKEKKEEAGGFVKLVEMEVFLKRKEVQQHRSEELRQANERMLATHLADKDHVERLRGEIQQMKEKYERTLGELQRHVEGLKNANAQLQGEVEQKEKALVSSRQLYEQYAKENNQLKAKIKDHLKTIHHLKADISTNEPPPPVLPPPPSQPTTDRKPLPKVALQQRIANDYATCLPRSPRREITFNQLHQEVNSHFYEASPYYELTERQLPPSRIDRTDREREARLVNCRSQGLLGRQPDQPESGIQAGEVTSRSQKGVGIRRNNPHAQPISPSTRNLVRVGKGVNAQNSILVGDKLKDNKSLSSYSNLSGKSLSQRVGFVSKPAQGDRGKGLLVDYMVETAPAEPAVERVKESVQRLQFRRGDQ